MDHHFAFGLAWQAPPAVSAEGLHVRQASAGPPGFPMHLCAACAERGRTCCQGTDILLTRDDLHRIRRHTGLEAIWEARPPRDPTCLGDDGDPNWLLYTLRPDGRRRVLRHAAPHDVDCFFLGPAGCRLPLDVRPLICRLHPLTYTEQAVTGTSEDCPGHLLPEGLDLLAAIGMSVAEGEPWRAQLYRELREEALGGTGLAEPAGWDREALEWDFDPLSPSVQPSDVRLPA